MNMNIFPTSEIGLVRREMLLLKEELSENKNDDDTTDNVYNTPAMIVLEQEVRVAEKKAMLFRTRRLDEERIMSQHISDAAGGMQYIERDGEVQQQQQPRQSSGNGVRKSIVRDSARF